jgi:hypothetical protein
MSGDEDISTSHVQQRYTFWNVFVVALPVIAFLAMVAFFWIRSVRWNAEVERLAKVDEATRNQIVQDVEAVRAKLGRVPKDQTELEIVMEKPMPKVHPGGYPTNVYYFRKSDDTYFVFSSRKLPSLLLPKRRARQRLGTAWRRVMGHPALRLMETTSDKADCRCKRACSG